MATYVDPSFWMIPESNQSVLVPDEYVGSGVSVITDGPIVDPVTIKPNPSLFETGIVDGGSGEIVKPTFVQDFEDAGGFGDHQLVNVIDSAVDGFADSMSLGDDVQYSLASYSPNQSYTLKYIAGEGGAVEMNLSTVDMHIYYRGRRIAYIRTAGDRPIKWQARGVRCWPDQDVMGAEPEDAGRSFWDEVLDFLNEFPIIGWFVKDEAVASKDLSGSDNIISV